MCDNCRRQEQLVMGQNEVVVLDLQAEGGSREPSIAELAVTLAMRMPEGNGFRRILFTLSDAEKMARELGVANLQDVVRFLDERVTVGMELAMHLPDEAFYSMLATIRSGGGIGVDAIPLPSAGRANLGVVRGGKDN